MIGFRFILALMTAITPVIGNGAETPLREPRITAADREHWAFRPLASPSLPEVANEQSVNNVIDRFVLAGLESGGLTLSPPASRRTLIRRLSFDLTGLPPTEEEIDLFSQDFSPDAYERLVDRYLSSPRYGERWAQHWLDLVRFAETDGFEHDRLRKEVWRYRNWVIEAFNRDLPYDRFLRAQLAGDEIGDPEFHDEWATGFLLAGPDMPDINLVAERRHNVLNEMTATVGSVFLGLGVGCAQCHDHKQDPISQADFYRLRAFFSNTVKLQKNVQLGHVVNERGRPVPESRLAVRGDFRRPGALLHPGFLRVLNPSGQLPDLSLADDRSSYRRAALANWLTSEDHPLTARVMVNRLWQHYFGRALAATPNDFGVQGRLPDHPELLDWLAVELTNGKWSLKRIHRLIVSSATYRQASFGAGPEWQRKLTLDLDNRWYARMNRRRLSGEGLRDAMLALTETLYDRQGGPSVRPPLPEEVKSTLLSKLHWVPSSAEKDRYRRSVYVFVRRNLIYPFFDVFDRPDANGSCAQRHSSTTVSQSLTLLNSDFSLAMAENLAQLAIEAKGERTEEALVWAYRRALGREPRAEERSALQVFLAGQDRTDPMAILTDFSLALFNCNEFLYLD